MVASCLIKNARILDVISGDIIRSDILVENGVITELREGIRKEAEVELDAEGLLITTGWVDDHAHFFYDSDNHIGVNPSLYFLPFGVTYAIDPGTAGADDYGHFRESILWSTDLRFKSYLNISRIGVPVYGYDLTDLSNLDEEACKTVFRRYRNEFVGLKARITSNMCADPLAALQALRRMCDELDTHFCVHATRCDLPSETILSFLKKGDMLTHAFASTDSGILDENGKVRSCVREARERGVIFDMGHGINSFTFETARKAMADGFQLDSLSTDIHVSDVAGPLFDMPTTLSKYLALDVDLLTVLRMVTVNPVRNLNLTDKSLTLAVGQRADFTAFALEEGTFRFTDCAGEVLEGRKRIVSRFTCMGEKIYTPIRRREANRKIGNAAIEERDAAERV